MVTQAEWDDMMDEVRKGMAPREPRPADRLWPSGGRDRIALLVVIAGIIMGVAAILAPREHASYWQALGNTLAAVAGMGIMAMLGVYGKWRRGAVARNMERQRR